MAVAPPPHESGEVGYHMGVDGQQLAVALLVVAVLVAAWVVVATHLTRQRNRRLALALRTALLPLGREFGSRWLGVSGFHLQVRQARPPLLSLDCVGMLASRQALLLWLWRRARGAGDTLVFRAQLARPSSISLDLVTPGSTPAREAERTLGRSLRPLADGDLLLAAGDGGGERLAAALLLALPKEVRPGLRRLALRPQAPHLLVAFERRDLDQAWALAALRATTRLAEIVAGERDTPGGRDSVVPNGRSPR